MDFAAIAKKNISAGKSPFANERITSLEDIFEIISVMGWSSAPELEPGKSRIDLQAADLSYLNLANASLNYAQLQGANLFGADLRHAQLQGADLRHASADLAEFHDANLRDADLREAHLIGAFFIGADLSAARFDGADLERAYLSAATAADAHFSGARMAYMTTNEQGFFERAYFDETDLRHAQLPGANFQHANLRGADLTHANVRGAHLEGAHLDDTTTLEHLQIDEATCWLDVRWNGVLLTLIDWATLKKIGDEQLIMQGNHKRDPKAYRAVARAYYGLQEVLRAQGLPRDAARFRLRAQSFEIQALRLEKQWLRWFGSSVLHVTTGYGDHLPRIFGCYFLFISSFGIIYFLLNNYYLAHQQWDFPHLFNDGWAKFWDAMVYSVTAFHGRGFFPGFAQLPGMSMATTAHDPRVVLGALEAMIGVFIELTLLASFSRRFFR